MGTVDCQQGMEGWYDAAVCGLVREVVGVYEYHLSTVISHVCRLRFLTQGGVVYYFSCLYTPHLFVGIEWLTQPRGSGLPIFQYRVSYYATYYV